MSVFEALKGAWDVVSGVEATLEKDKPPIDRVGSGMSTVGGAMAGLAGPLGLPAWSVLGPLAIAGGTGLQIGSYADRKLGLSTKISDAMVDTDDDAWAQGTPPVHFRGEAGNAEAKMLATGRQQAFLRDETARQLDIAKWTKLAEKEGALPGMSVPRTMLKNYGIDLDEKQRQKEMMGLFGHLTQ